MREGDVGAFQKNRGRLWGGPGTPKIAIVGAGFGGIGLGALLSEERYRYVHGLRQG